MRKGDENKCEELLREKVYTYLKKKRMKKKKKSSHEITR
jgi:hypothetical protein